MYNNTPQKKMTENYDKFLKAIIVSGGTADTKTIMKLMNYPDRQNLHKYGWYMEKLGYVKIKRRRGGGKMCEFSLRPSRAQYVINRLKDVKLNIS